MQSVKRNQVSIVIFRHTALPGAHLRTVAFSNPDRISLSDSLYLDQIGSTFRLIIHAADGSQAVTHRLWHTVVGRLLAKNVLGLIVLTESVSAISLSRNAAQR